MTKNEQGNAMSKDSGLSRRDLMGAMALSIAVGRLVPSPAAADMTDQKPIGGRTMTLDEYSRYDAVGLAELVRRQEISPTELAHTALAAVAAVNPRINAVVETFPERVASATASGPLGGVPFLRKDILIQEAGGLTEFGSRFAAGLRMPDASELALRFQRAGLVTLGRTTTPELAFNATTENVKDGPTRNPWNRDRSAGGSSEDRRPSWRPAPFQRRTAMMAAAPFEFRRDVAGSSVSNPPAGASRSDLVTEPSCWGWWPSTR
jgi:hypothetical protein